MSDTGAEHADGVAGAMARPIRRWRLPVAVLCASVLSAIAGFVAASGLRPAQTAVAASPSRQPVTAAVDLRVLAVNMVTRGDLGYGDPIPIRLAGAVQSGASGLLVTRAARLDAVVRDGDVLAEVSGRPIFVLTGAVPMYRAIGEGSVGADVRQLEKALAAAGLHPGRIDGVYDAALQRAVDHLYTRNGYVAPAPSPEALDALRARRATVRQAEDSLAAAQAAYDAALRALTGPDHLELQAALLAAQDALAQVESDATQADAAADSAVANADAQVANAKDGLAQAQATGMDPANPGALCDTACMQSLSDALATATAGQQAALEAQKRAYASGKAQVDEAQLRLQAAQARLDSSEGGAAVKQAGRARSRAAADLTQARADLATAAAQAHATIPPGEVVFQPRLPLRVREVKAAVGTAPDSEIAVLASDQRVVRATVTPSDVADLRPGMNVTMDAGSGTQPYQGAILKVGLAPAADTSAGPNGEMLVDASAVPSEVATGVSLRVTVPLRTSGGKVLVVPLVAVTSLTSGDSVVYVLGSDGRTRRRVVVRVGLSAEGMVQVSSADGSLKQGDLVVVGE